MEHYSIIIFCSGQAFKSVVVVLSISFVIMLSFLYLPTNSFAYAEVRQQQEQRQQLSDTVMASTTTIEVTKQNLSLDQNIPGLKYGYNSSSLKPFSSELGTESKNNNNWITVNHDIYGTRSSNQTIIKKDNVGTLQVKWRLINDVEIQDPPIIVGNRICAGLFWYHYSI